MRQVFKRVSMFGIRIIFGKFGVGKGVTNTIIAINEIDDETIYESGCSAIVELEQCKGRTFEYPPQKHLVFSNYDIRYEGFKNYPFDPSRFMLPNSEHSFDIFPPFSCFHIEEGQSDGFSAYDWSDFPAPALMAFSRVRHPSYTFTIDLQFIENLNKNLRRFAFEYITPLSLEYNYNCLNNRIQTVSHCAVFYDYARAKMFEDNKDPKLIDEIRPYLFKGDIFECFDSHSKKHQFFEVDSKKDFVYDLAFTKSLYNQDFLGGVI